MQALLAMLRAAGDPTRLRLFLILRQAELTVSELTQILGQSQPRVSRHLKLLCEAGLLDRFKEGSWVFYRAADSGPGARLGRAAGRAGRAGRRWRPTGPGSPPCARPARRWRRPSSRPTRRIGSASARSMRLKRMWRTRSCASFRALRSRSLLDAGTGTGRMLELLAPAYQARRRRRCRARRCWPSRATGWSGRTSIIARSGSAMSTGCPLRPARAEQGFDAVLFHQVLHYLDDPQARDCRSRARAETGRTHADRRFRAARSGIPAHRACPSPPRILRPRSAGLVSGSGAEAARLRRHRARTWQRPFRRGKLTVKIWVAANTATPCARARRRRHESQAPRGQRTPVEVSFEFFPPKTAEMEEQLWRAIRRLEPLGPAFVSVTYGAGGSTRDRTHATVKRIVDETDARSPPRISPASAHRAARSTRSCARYWDAGVRHIVALRGDMPEWRRLCAASGRLRIDVRSDRGHPQASRRSKSASRPIPSAIRIPPSAAIRISQLLKQKVDAGATRAHHAIRLRQCRVCALPRCRCARRASTFPSCRA